VIERPVQSGDLGTKEGDGGGGGEEGGEPAVAARDVALRGEDVFVCAECFCSVGGHPPASIVPV